MVKQLNIEILSWGAATDPGHPGGHLVSVITMILNCCYPPSVKHNRWINCKYVSNCTQRTRFPTTLCVDRWWTRSLPALLGLRWGLVADELLTYWRSDNVPSVWAIQPQSCPSASGSSAWTVIFASSFVSLLKPFMSPLVLSHSAIFSQRSQRRHTVLMFDGQRRRVVSSVFNSHWKHIEEAFGGGVSEVS